MDYWENKNSKNFREPLLVLGVLVISMICLYPTLNNGWVNWDDPAYVLKNPLVHQLNQSAISTMFSTPVVVGLYHPFTLLSLSIDFYFWGNNPIGFHLTNLILHLFNVALVFVFFRKLKSSLLVAFLVSLLYGIHPMHVESVAWISARKDVLYVFFFLLGLLSYLYMQNLKNSKRIFLFYFLTFICFIASLLSKNIAFTFPIILLLIDYFQNRKLDKSIFINKTPFFILAIVSIFIMKYGQQASDSMGELTMIEYGNSILIGVFNSVFYIYKLLLPIDLAAFHPFPLSTETPIVYYLAIAPFLGFIYSLYWFFKKSRKVFFGLLFFLISIGPLLQIIPFGKAISSERYTYLAYIGLFYVLAIFVEYMLTSFNKSIKNMTISIVFIWFILLAYQTNKQSRVWKNSNTLWSQVLDLYPDSHWAYMSRGLYFIEQEEYSKAYEDLNVSIAINPIAQSLYERGRLHELKGQFNEAINDYLNSVELDPSYAKSHMNLGVIFSRKKDSNNAIAFFEKAIDSDSTYALAFFNYATTLKLMDKLEEAIGKYNQAVLLEPNNKLYRTARGVLHTYMGHSEESISDLTFVLKGNNKEGELYYYRSISYKKLGKEDLAAKDVETAKALGYDIKD